MIRRKFVLTLLLVPQIAHGDARIEVEGGAIDVEFAGNDAGTNRGLVLAWVDASARAVAGYYGRFPAPSTRLIVVPRRGRDISGGRTWAASVATIRIRVGVSASETDFKRDWVLVHEMTHLALPSLPRRHAWLEEGLATYVESIARAQAGQLTDENVWSGFMEGMPNGLPQSGDLGLDRTHTWGRTYWGGAIYCLLADVEIRRRTGNRRGLQDALRAILAEGNMETSSELAPLLAIGDRAVGVPVLAELYDRMRNRPEPAELDSLWRRLGVERQGNIVRFDDDAPDAVIRQAITAPPPRR